MGPGNLENLPLLGKYRDFPCRLGPARNQLPAGGNASQVPHLQGNRSVPPELVAAPRPGGEAPRRAVDSASLPDTSVQQPKTMSTADYSNHRWILDVPSRSTVREVADRTIRLRIAAVTHFLPLAAAHADEDIEYVHQLRVATRRAVAAIRLYQSWLPAKRRRRLCRLLKQIRRAAGEARDCDVLLARQATASDSTCSDALLDDLRRRRASADPLG